MTASTRARLRAGIVAGGVGVAVLAGPAVAVADSGVPGDDGRRPVSAGPKDRVAARPGPATRPRTERVSPRPVTRLRAAAAPGPVGAAALAAKAYVYGYPLMEYQRVRQTVGDVNTLHSLTSFANPDLDPMWRSIGGGKRPNVDTFYSLAELDLSNGPVVLSVPDMGSRYFSFQLTDPYTNTSAYIGSRTTGSGPGK